MRRDYRREGLVRRDYRREGLVRRDYRREGLVRRAGAGKEGGGWSGGTTGGRGW